MLRLRSGGGEPARTRGMMTQRAHNFALCGTGGLECGLLEAQSDSSVHVGKKGGGVATDTGRRIQSSNYAIA